MSIISVSCITRDKPALVNRGPVAGVSVGPRQPFALLLAVRIGVHDLMPALDSAWFLQTPLRL